jgi:ATP synthase protein I
MGHRLHSDELSQGSAASALHPTSVPAAAPPPSRAAAPYASKTRGYYRTLSASSVGLELAVSVILCMLVGRWLDGKWGTTPWLMIAGVVLGFTAGMRALYRHVAMADRDAARAEAETRHEKPGAE